MLLVVANRWDQAFYNASHETCMHCIGQSPTHPAEDYWTLDEEI